MKKEILGIMLAVISCNITFSQSQEVKKSAFQFTFFPPVGTQGVYASRYSNGVSFNLLAGISQDERYFTLGSLGNIVKNDASGLQLAGVANITRNNAYAFQLAGVSNIVGNNGKGIALSGVANISKEYKGCQLAGVANMASNNVHGFQLAGVSNIVGNNGKGMALSGVANISKEYGGCQLAGIANMAGDVNGFQLAGVFNKAKKVKGVQFAGILNIADESDYSIGLINIIKNGEMGIGISYNEIGSTVLSLRSGGRLLYGIIGLGYNHRSVSPASFVFEAGYGVHINFSEKFRINTEAKAQLLSMFANQENSQYSLAILPALKLGSNFEIFAGPSISYLISDNTDNEKLFPKNTSINIWKSFGSSRLKQVNIGFSIGTQFLF